MKRTLLALILMTALVGPVLAGDAPVQEVQLRVTGLEWLEMSVGEKTDEIIKSMLVMTQHGVPLGRTPNDYYKAVQQKLNQQPALYGSLLTDILAAEVYDKEPSCREALDNLRPQPKPRIQKIEMH